MPHLRHCAASLIVIAAFAPAVALAQSAPGLNSTYISLSGLYVKPTDSDVSVDPGGGDSLRGDLKMDAGFGILVALGYGPEVGLRGEVEFGFRKTDIDKLDGASVEFEGISISLDDAEKRQGVDILDLSVGGDVSTLSLMLNGIYAFEASRLRPYFGVGIGLARHDATLRNANFEYVGTVPDLPNEISASSRDSDDDIVLAYQAMAGIAYPVSETMEARIGYRYFATADADFDGTEASYGTHNLEAGILVRF